MSFDSFVFAVFLPIAWSAYWLLGRWRLAQNVLIILASYVFYGWHDPRLIILLVSLALWGYFVHPRNKGALAISIIVTCAPLVYFNYTSQTLLVAVGLSFTVFQTISYLVDVYQGKIERVRDASAYFAYMAFFPQILAGPIERAGNLCVQFMAPRQFDRPLATLGCRQFLWGLVVKCVVADNCASVADACLVGESANGLASFVGILFYSVQIYADFSGYSDMALGLANLFGLQLKRNFNFPYFAENIADFWRRWHISLTSWLRDYIYIPLGGSRCSKGRTILNTLIVFTISGAWHGCGWNFLVWGVLHGLFFIPLLLGVSALRNSRLVMLMMVVFCWTFFRAPDIATAGNWISGWFDFTSYGLAFPKLGELEMALGVMVPFFIVEFFNRHESFGCARLPKWAALRWIIYFIQVMIIVFCAPGSQSFVYYQF